MNSSEKSSHHTLHPDFTNKYALSKELGRGGFGFVMSAYERQTGVERAVKFIIRQRVPQSAWVSDREMGIIPMEIHVLKHVQHPNIIQLCDIYQDSVYFYLVMEIHGSQWESTESLRSPALSQTSHSTLDDDYDEPARRTSCDLFECLEQHQYFDEGLAKMVFRQVVDCVAYLDTLGVCHRDIKDENIVIDQDYKVKLIDFGSAVLVSPQTRFVRFYGTILFASPEILMHKHHRAEPAEIWSLGILLYTLLFGQVPFPDPTSAISGCMVQPKIKVSFECRQLITALLEKDPERRPTIHQVLKHPWFIY
ncbi:hypothetical protein G6F56_000446 [Rhizopus delemar]|uniref:Protein kinase domain-containing protein n=1 Tax=Rhizopus stolonifer TaxID=4846 RepID=A0A367J9B4_RHIST|nr:hypothetical protein G6F56_000446 [Rhizopus delemar]RCH86542.1 hypothetical protein CU098_004745 [Rhizopus stolonifer]